MQHEGLRPPFRFSPSLSLHSAQPNSEHLTLWPPIPSPPPCATPSPVVLDTNVVPVPVDVRGSFPGPPTAGRRERRPAPLRREDCLGELARVSATASSSNQEERQLAIASAYRARCTLIDAPPEGACELPHCLDRDDQKFLEVARDSGAQALLSRGSARPQARPQAQLIAALYAILTPERLQAPAGADRPPRGDFTVIHRRGTSAPCPGARLGSSHPGACHGHRYEFRRRQPRHHLPDPPRLETSRGDRLVDRRRLGDQPDRQPVQPRHDTPRRSSPPWSATWRPRSA